MTEHTEGPWAIVTRTGPREVTLQRRHWEIGQQELPHRGVGIAFGDTEANARLIAAAPELLDALKQALVVMESVAETHGYDTEVGAVPAARAAIAKAEGK